MTAIKARPTLYKGIQMRSRLEADFAAALDRSGHSWEYEPTCFGGAASQWLPDFGIPDRNTLVELKPAYLAVPGEGEDHIDVMIRIDEILSRMSIAWLSEPAVRLQLIFWTYQADVPTLGIVGHPDAPWLAASDGGFPLMWPGMGQSDSVKERNLPGETLRRLNGLPVSPWHQRHRRAS